MEITANAVKDLREKTGAGMMDCKKALSETQGDFEKAVVWLREKGMSQVAKRSGRSANQGVIGSYVHGGKVGVLVEVNCETDFVAKTDDFQNLAKELAMQVAASLPKYVSREEVPAAELEQEKSIYLNEAKQSGKLEAVQQKIAEGKIESYYKQVCLLDQPYIREPKKNVKEYVTEVAAKLGENVVVRASPGCNSANNHLSDCSLGLGGENVKGMSEWLQLPPKVQSPNPLYRRVLLKLSGEALAGDNEHRIDEKVVQAIAKAVFEVQKIRGRDRPRHRGRQHLPRRGRRAHGDGPGFLRLYGHAGHPHQRPGPAKRPGKAGGPSRGSKVPLRCPRWPNPTSGEGPCGT